MSVWHQLIHSHSLECTSVPWESLSSLVISLVFVNGIHQWPVMKWFLPCLTSVPLFTWLELYLWDWDEDPGIIIRHTTCWSSLSQVVMGLFEFYMMLHRSTLYKSMAMYLFLPYIHTCIILWLQVSWVMEVCIHVLSLVAITVVIVSMDLQCIGWQPCSESFCSERGNSLLGNDIYY